MTENLPIIRKPSLDKLRIWESYKRSPYLSLKHDSYFQVYEELLGKYVGKPITFVEVGVLNGGSLFMWREFLGPEARIIGIDLNPLARKWESHGFEIHIGNQSDPKFWEDFFSEIKAIDVLLDDGGHTNPQQIVTTISSIGHVNDGGMLIVEDVHTSYFKGFGNPSRYSFISLAKRIVDSVNSRFPAVDVVKNKFGGKVYSVYFFESIVVFNIDSTKCFVSTPTRNVEVSSETEDFRHMGSTRGWLTSKLRFLKDLAFVRYVADFAFSVMAKSQSRRYRKHFE